MQKKQKKLNLGFTLVEVMAVLIIVGLLATVAVTNFMGQTDKAKVSTTKANLKVLHNAVLQFKMDTGRYPTEEEGLYALIEEPTDVEGWQPGGYLNSTNLPYDGWKHEFIYQLDPESGKPFVIISYGADDEPEGEDYNADLYSTDAN
ncbi:MAG: type II secretion system major pseudopilin GspG [Sedimentisphaerales bacterium]|nr:type II secretion system major pseudopilin GspG [Sedimentisphaerales bacterium]